MKLLSILIYSSLRVYNASTRWAHDLKWQRKIKKLIKARNAPKPSNSQLAAIKKFYAEKNLHSIKTYWHSFYTSCNGNFSTGYVPENLFYTVIEPKLNDRQFASVLMDKNLLEKLFPNAKQPHTVVKNINGFFFTNSGEMIDLESVKSICDKYGTLFIKPTIETGGGKGVSAFNLNDNVPNTEKKEFGQVLKDYNKNFIIQKKVEQHEIMSSLNPTSLNTLRVVSYLKNNEVFILSSIVRMGIKGSIIDNSSAGGVSCGIKPNGSLKETGFKMSGEKSDSTSTGIKFGEIRLPFMTIVHDEVKKLHREVPYFKMVSWDLAVDTKSEVILIEYNIKGQEITFHQLNNGPVLTRLLEEL